MLRFAMRHESEITKCQGINWVPLERLQVSILKTWKEPQDVGLRVGLRQVGNTLFLGQIWPKQALKASSISPDLTEDCHMTTKEAEDSQTSILMMLLKNRFRSYGVDSKICLKLLAHLRDR